LGNRKKTGRGRHLISCVIYFLNIPIAVVAGASAAEAIATATDKAIQDHQAAGNTTQSAVTSLAAIARAVANSNVTSDSTAAKINTIVNVLDPTMMGA